MLSRAASSARFVGRIPAVSTFSAPPLQRAARHRPLRIARAHLAPPHAYTPQRGMATGTTKWFNISKGFGAILLFAGCGPLSRSRQLTRPLPLPPPHSFFPAGFITPDDKGQPDCFVHQSAIQMANAGFRFLKETERVRLRAMASPPPTPLLPLPSVPESARAPLTPHLRTRSRPATGPRRSSSTSPTGSAACRL